ncbi:MAG: hypothetical protein Alis3KO_05340 [Aliiglaciecola sp.]
MLETPHGEIDIKWINKVLLCAPLGPINGNGAKLFAEKICHSINNKRPVSPWLRVELFRDFYTLATPDAYRFLMETLIHSRKHQCEMLCVVGVNSCNTSLFKQYSEMVGLPFISFGSLPSLITFLQERNLVKEATELQQWLESNIVSELPASCF